MKKRCQWPSNIEMDYHDTEWGVPVTDEKKWFEFLVLDSFQAGLSWKIILQKREGFRKAFYDFDVQKVAQMTDEDMARLREDSSIIRNRLKIKLPLTMLKPLLGFKKNMPHSILISGVSLMEKPFIISTPTYRKYPPVRHCLTK